MDFRQAWDRVAELEGETFRTARGVEFSYRFKRTFIVTEPAGQSIPRTNFDKVFKRISGAGAHVTSVQGQAFIEAVFHDNRFEQAS